MAIIAKFTRTLPAPSATISGGFVFLLSAGWFTQADQGAAGSPIDGGTNSLANGGGDMQIFSDTATTTRLPVDAVTFVTGGLPVAQVWVRTTSYTAGDTITIGKDDTQTTQPAFGAAFGRNATWADFEYNFHFNSSNKLVDSTGNYSLTENGTVTQVTGVIGDAASFGMVFTNYYAVNGFTGVLGSAARTIKTWFKTSQSNTGLHDCGTNTTAARYTMYVSSGKVRTEINGSFSMSALTYNDGNFHSFVSKEDGTSSFPASHTTIIDGVNITGSDSQGGSQTLNTASSGNVRFRADRNASNELANDVIDETSCRLFETSDDLDASEHSNQINPDNFGTSSEWVLVGGGVSLSIESGSYSLTGTDVILIDPPANEVMVIGVGSYSMSGANVNLIADYKEAIPSGAYAYTGADVILIDPIVPGSITIESGAYSVTGALIQTSINSPVNTGAYSLSGTAINFVITRGMTIEQGSYIIQGTNINFSDTGNIWTDKPSVNTLWGDKAPVITNWADK